MRNEYNLGPVFFLDTWPAFPPMMVIQDPAVAQQVTVQHSLPKHESVKSILETLSGRENLVAMEGMEWKKWRSVFNPGFSAAHLMTLVPGIVDDALIFANILDQHASKGDVFRLDDALMNLTIDVIGKVVMCVSCLFFAFSFSFFFSPLPSAFLFPTFLLF